MLFEQSCMNHPLPLKKKWWEGEKDREREREINESDFSVKVYLGDSNRQPQPSRENLECYP